MCVGLEHIFEEDVFVQLERMRVSIDNLDSAMVYLLAERFTQTRSIGQLKAEYALPAVDHERQNRQAERIRTLAQEVGLDSDFVERLFAGIVDKVVEDHLKTRQERKPDKEPVVN